MSLGSAPYLSVSEGFRTIDRGGRWTMITRDLAYAWRVARRRPAFSLAVILTLALGIGGNTAIFGLVHAIVLNPLPYPDSDRLVSVLEQHASGRPRIPSYPTFKDWEAEDGVFDRLGYARGVPVTYRAEGSSGLLLAAFVSPEFFDILGNRAHIGRALTADDHASEADGAVVLSHRAWQRWFGADPAVLGDRLVVDDLPFTIVGVLPATFAYPDWGAENDLWMPLTRLPPGDLAALNQRGFTADSRVIARLRPDVTPDQARRRMESVAAALASAYPETNADWTGVRIESLKDTEIRAVRPRLYMLWGAAGFVLLICCLNLANLYIVHGKSRSQEYALRTALGAARGQMLRQIFAEALLLAALGGLLGTLIAFRALGWAREGGLSDLPRVQELGLSPFVVLFAAGVSLLAALLFALLAHRHAGRASARAARDSPGSASLSLPNWIQAGQVCVAFVLLVGGWLLGSSFLRLAAVNPGYDPERLILVPINPPSPTYDAEEAAVGLYRALVEAVENVPGVTSVALTNHGPGGRAGLPTPASIGGVPQDTDDDFSVIYRTVSDGYFRTVGIPVASGREFDASDLAGGEGPVVINETLAGRWGGASPLGQVLGVRKASSARSDFGEPISGRVVGVVADLDPSERGGTAVPVVYVPFTHSPWSQVRILARVGEGSVNTLRAIEDAVRSVDPAIPLAGPFVGPRRFEDLRAGQRSDERLNAGLVTGFATVALLLVLVGIYGVVSYAVVVGAKAIGVRMALGATPQRILVRVMRQAAYIAVTGVVVGMVASAFLSRLIDNFLFDVQALDARPYLAIAGLLLTLVTLASYLPAARAARLDPVAVLRAD